MRKILIIFCTVLMLAVTALPVCAASSVSASLSVSNKTVNAGDKITITVSAKVDSCGSGGIEISYNSSVFELSSGDWVIKGAMMTDFSKNSKDGVFAFDSATKISGKIFKFVLKVKSNAPVGKSTVTIKFKADSESVSKSTTITVACAHSYSNQCDTKCNKCGATRKISHAWNGGEVIKTATCAAEGSVKYTCTVCKEIKTEKSGKSEHTYDNACDTSCNVCNAAREITHAFAWECDKAEHWLACTVCGEQIDRGTHSLDSTFTGNEAGHGHACTVCLLIPEAQPHIFDATCDTDCSECNYVRTITHIYSPIYFYNKDVHWLECVMCGDKHEESAHIPGDAATQYSDQTCTQCGYIIATGDNHIHVRHDDWLSDETGHWYQCRCGETTQCIEHNWDDGIVDNAKRIVTYSCVDCGYSSAEAYISEPEQSTVENMLQEILGDIPLWMVLAAGLGVSVVINIVFIISVSVLRRRIKRTLL